MKKKFNMIFFNSNSNFKFESVLKKFIYCIGITLVSAAISPVHAFGELSNTKIEVESNTIQQTITGTVVDEDGNSLPGVGVFKKGTTQGVETDFDGNYSIDAAQGDILVFSFIGMTSVEVTVAAETTANVTLAPDAAELDEVVVVGYGKQKKSSLTGAVGSVDAKQLTTVSVANTTELLAGRVAGVITKQTSSVPGADNTSLNIRGFGSPLILVDGIQMELARIDPNDIESVNVLKDAAAAVYGARAGNGVILVTTKRGKIGKPVISYSGITSFQQPTVWRNNVDGGQFTEMQNEGGAASYTPEELAKFKAGTEPGYETYDWEKTVFREWAPMTQHSLSARGGSENVKFFSSFGYLDQAGQFRSGDLNFKKINLRSNMDAKINDNLSFGVDFSYRKDERGEPGNNLNAIYQQVTVSEPILPPVIPGYPELAANSGGGFGNRAAYGASQRQLSGYIDTNGEVFTAKMELNYKFNLEGLTAKAMVSYISQTTQAKRLNLEMPVYGWDLNELEPRLTGSRGNNSLTETLYQYKMLQPSIQLNYDRDFGDHSVNALILTEIIDEDYLNQSGSRKDLLSTDLPYLNLGSELGIGNSGSASERGRSSVVGRINYGYKGKYFIEGAFRRDATHNFAEGQRWGFFPSVSGAWRISEEDFMEEATWLNNLKLRMSYSETGRDDIGQYRYLSAYEIQTGAYSPYLLTAGGLSTAIATNGIANPDATWRDFSTYNLGIEAEFLNGLIGVELDIFYREQTGIFATPLDQFPSTFGATLPQLNQNARENQGFDLMLTHRKSFGDFKYDVALNLGHAREKYVIWPVDRAIEAYADSEEELNDQAFIERFNLIQLQEGNYVNRNIGYKSDGIFMNQAEIDAHELDQSLVAGGTGNERLVPGDIRYKDLNGDGVLNWRDQDEIGSGALPETTYGINLNASYKNFSMSVLLQGASGFNFNITGGARNILNNNSIPYQYQYKHRWTPDPIDPTVNINPNAILPGSTDAGAHPNNDVTSDFWLQDGKYLRVKSLNIGYDLPSDLLSSIGFKQIRIYGAASNLYTWNNLGIYKGTFDSEGPANQGGSTYPLVKTLSLGINISL
jgi:TonB-linked SusC/RagA family outer membrane protein